jgi:hypothetical protein
LVSAPQESLPMISWTCCRSYLKGEQVGQEPKKRPKLPVCHRCNRLCIL